ncbi:hypothetical protein Tco_1178589, partial [Tanacetum coccineum]
MTVSSDEDTHVHSGRGGFYHDEGAELTRTGYSLKDKNKAKPDKTEHGFGKSAKNRGQGFKRSKNLTIPQPHTPHGDCHLGNPQEAHWTTNDQGLGSNFLGNTHNQWARLNLSFHSHNKHTWPVVSAKKHKREEDKDQERQDSLVVVIN